MAVQMCDLRIMGLDLRNLMVRSYLIEVIGRSDPNLPTYGELHQDLGGGNQNRGRFLQGTHEDCGSEAPDLTVLIVGANARFPSRFDERFDCRGRCRTWASSPSPAPWRQSAWSGWS